MQDSIKNHCEENTAQIKFILLGSNNCMNMDAKQRGNVTELKCITYLMELGYNVSIPYGENCRYDFILDVDNILIKIQCKTCRVKQTDSVIYFSCESNRNNGKYYKRTQYSCSDVDYFATYYNNVCYLVPSNECSTSKQLRLLPTKNKQNQHINIVKDYNAENQIKMLLKHSWLCT